MKKIILMGIFIFGIQSNGILGFTEKKQEYSKLDVAKLKNEICYHLFARMLEGYGSLSSQYEYGQGYKGFSKTDEEKIKFLSDLAISMKCLE